MCANMNRITKNYRVMTGANPVLDLERLFAERLGEINLDCEFAGSGAWKNWARRPVSVYMGELGVLATRTGSHRSIVFCRPGK
jgi:hypothetical protein